MSLAATAGIFHKDELGRYKQPMNESLVGRFINSARVYITDLEAVKGPTTSTKVMRVFSLVLTMTAGVVVTPFELIGRAGLGAVYTLQWMTLEDKNPEAAENYKNYALQELKTMLIAAKVWIMFSNPILDAALVIYTFMPDSYNMEKQTAENQLFEKAIGTPNALARRNCVTTMIDKLATSQEPADIAQVSKRIFYGLVAYSAATGGSALNFTFNAVALPMTKAGQFAGRHSANAFNSAASLAMDGINLITGKARTPFQIDVAAFEKRQDAKMKAQATRIFDEGLHLAILYNPLAVAFIILEYALEPLFAELQPDTRAPAEMRATPVVAPSAPDFDAGVAAMDAASGKPRPAAASDATSVSYQA